MTDSIDARPGDPAFREKAIASFKRKTTMIDLWSDNELLSRGGDWWIERTRAVAALVPPGSRVLDIGCGDMRLESELPAGCAYIPLDVVRRDERTIVLDLNKQRLPAIEADIVVGLGVLEYLFDMPAVLRQLSRQFPRAVFTYHPLEKGPGRDRVSIGWVNALNTPELVSVVKQSGWRNVKVSWFRRRMALLEASRPPRG